jgi:hypothetical protein
MSARARSIRICRNGRSPQRRCLNGSKNRIRPRFNAACPPSPAAGTPNGQIAGTSITVTCGSARSQDASVIRLTLIHGNGIAASEFASARTHERYRRHLRPSPRRFRACLGSVLTEPDGGRLPAEKYRRFDRGERMPPNWKPSHAAAG